MKILYSGFLKLKYDPNKYNSFKKYIEFKENIDEIFEVNNISPEKIPKTPTKEHSKAYYDFVLEYQSPKFHKFMNIVEELKLKDQVFFTLEFKFTKKEMEQAPLLSMATYYNFYATNIKFPSEFGTEYEKIFACPKCGSVKYKQLTPLHWNTAQMKKKMFMEIPDDKFRGSHAIIITERLAIIFKEQGFTGYSLEPVIHVGRKDKEIKCFQMIVNHVMPPFSEKMPFIKPYNEDDCTNCVGRGRIIFPAYYDRASLVDIEDFNLSFEEDVSIVNRKSLLLVSQRVKQLFDSLRIKPVYEPVVIVEEE